MKLFLSFFIFIREPQFLCVPRENKLFASGTMLFHPVLPHHFFNTL